MLNNDTPYFESMRLGNGGVLGGFKNNRFQITAIPSTKALDAAVARFENGLQDLDYEDLSSQQKGVQAVLTFAEEIMLARIFRHLGLSSQKAREAMIEIYKQPFNPSTVSSDLEALLT